MAVERSLVPAGDEGPNGLRIVGGGAIDEPLGSTGVLKKKNPCDKKSPHSGDKMPGTVTLSAKARREAIENLVAAVEQAVRDLSNRVLKTTEERQILMIDLGSAITRISKERPRRPARAPYTWPEDRLEGEDAIRFVKRVYGAYIVNGMTQADLRKLDEGLYRALNSRCTYLSIKTADVLNPSENHGKTNMAYAAAVKGLLAGPVVAAPRRSEVGKTLSSQEFEEKRRQYQAQQKRVQRWRQSGLL